MTYGFTLDEKYRTGYWLDVEYGKIYEISHGNVSPTYPKDSDDSEPKVMKILLKPIHPDNEQIALSASAWEKMKSQMKKVNIEKLNAPSEYVDEIIQDLQQKDLTKLDGITEKEQQEFEEIYQLVRIQNSEEIYETKF
jgi:hypothetical protein